MIAVSLAGILAVPAWLWIEMPRRTATMFIRTIEAGNLDRANGLFANGRLDAMSTQQTQLSFRRGPTLAFADLRFRLLDRGIADVFAGRQPLKLCYAANRESNIRIQANWTSVIGDWPPSYGPAPR
jgi:hypothetical protein